ncbi:hypothetical protein DBV05_g7925 [Lasiodiplodia theobromae]|uniref:Uncharacterized protein n=1 Tax=Lasiodiplodia theobromae TaxID=45133 RepID=A0A5N5D6N4_9PEZI|nr:hypothetical protein DBV05_g7925 [Lasiodiplodia theobromae]
MYVVKIIHTPVTTHTVKIEVDPSWVSDFNKNGMKLCCAFFVRKGGREYCNVVAGAFAVRQHMSITWVDKYAIAATKSNYKARDKVAGGTTEVEISKGQSITVAPDGTAASVRPDNNVAKDAFRFIHTESPAAAVVYMTVADSQVPIYITNTHPDHPGKQDLSPIEKIKIWFDDQMEAKDYFDDISNLTHLVYMWSREVYTVQYTPEGKWAFKKAEKTEKEK